MMHSMGCKAMKSDSSFSRYVPYGIESSNLCKFYVQVISGTALLVRQESFLNTASMNLVFHPLVDIMVTRKLETNLV